MITGVELTEIGIGMTAVGALIKAAMHMGAMNTKLDRALSSIDDHEDRIRDLEKAPAPVADPAHVKPLRPHAI